MSETRQLWLLAGLVPPFTYVCAGMCVWPAPRLLGELSFFLQTFADMTALLFLAAVAASIWLALMALRCRGKAGEVLRRGSMSLACVCFVGLWLVAIRSAHAARHDAFVGASEVGDRIVEALEQYRTETGEYPNRLEQLIPAFLEEIPYTGMIAYPEFVYEKDRHDIVDAAGEYELRISCSSGILNFDRFIYWPSEKYPDRIQGNGVERIRKWAYVHE